MFDFVITNRKRKISKIKDKINGIKHEYIDSFDIDSENLYKELIKSSGIPKKYFGK